MRIPSYQWLMPEQNSNCDFCDEVSISSEFEPKFQILAEFIGDELIDNGDFDTNPFSLITSNNFTFDFNGSISNLQGFVLYVNGYIFRFQFVTAYGTNTTLDVDGDFHTITIENKATPTLKKEALRDALIMYLDPIIGTTTTMVAGVPSNYTISNIPINTHIFVENNLITNLNVITTGIDTYRFNYIGNKMCWYNLGSSSVTGYIKYNVVLTSGITYVLRLNNTSNTSFTGKVIIDDGTNPPFEEILDCTNSNQFITYESLLSSSHNFTIEVVSSADSGFCIDNISLLAKETLNSIEVINCDNEVLEINYATTIYNENILVEILESLPNPFQLKFTDSNDNVFYSRWYSIKESDDCDVQFKIDWTNNCKFSDLDYTNLPFTNQLLLTGVKIKNPLEVLDSVDNITPDGRKVSIYKNTQQTFELRLHPYSEETQSTLERIFDHSEVKINDELYNATEAYQTSEVDLGVYTGRVDLYKDGTQVITSSCCC